MGAATQNNMRSGWIIQLAVPVFRFFAAFISVYCLPNDHIWKMHCITVPGNIRICKCPTFYFRDEYVLFPFHPVYTSGRKNVAVVL